MVEYEHVVEPDVVEYEHAVEYECLRSRHECAAIDVFIPAMSTLPSKCCSKGAPRANS